MTPSHPLTDTVSITGTPQALVDLVTRLLQLAPLQTTSHNGAVLVPEGVATAEDEEPSPRAIDPHPPPEQGPVHAPADRFTGVLPAKLRGRYYLGRLCPQGHAWQQSDKSLRLRANHDCSECGKARKRARRRPTSTTVTPAVASPPARALRTTRALVPAPAAVQPLVVAATPPALPAYLAERAYLSMTLCPIPAHRYKGGCWTMRFRDTDECTVCVTARGALNGHGRGVVPLP
jgi:hypothetical protein